MRFVREILSLLLLAQTAAAQLVAPIEGVGRIFSAPVPVLSGTPLIAPAAGLVPVPAAPSLGAAIPAPVPIAAAPLKLASAAAAVVKFAALNVRSAPAAEARGGAETLWNEVLGVEAARMPALSAVVLPAADLGLPPEAPEPARTPEPRTHLLSKPLHETVQLGPVARTLHYGVEGALQFGKAALLWHASGSLTAAGALLAFELIKMPPMITAQSLMDLGLRYWWRKFKVVRRLANEPGVTRIRVLTTGDAEFSGILAVRKENNGLVFVDGHGLRVETIDGFGAPIPIDDLAERRVRLSMTHNGATSQVVWTPTLSELLDGRSLPPKIAKAWRKRLESDKKGMSSLRRVLDFSKEKELRIEAQLADGKGGETELGSIAFGRSVQRLVGLSRWDRVRALFGGKPAARALPISDTTVERGGVRSVEGWRRLWRRLTGRLLVRD